MWISKKKFEAERRKVRHEELMQSLKDHAEDRQWKDIQKLKKEVKKLKKIVREGY